MLSDPTIVTRESQRYVAIRHTVTMQTIGAELPPLNGEVFGWLAARGIAPSGAPLWKYDLIDMAGQLVVEVGSPVSDAVEGDDRVIAGDLPAGRYVTALFVGHPDGLKDATGALLAWGEAEGVTWDMRETPDGEQWGARVESYETDPAIEPDMAKWQTRLLFRLAD